MHGSHLDQALKVFSGIVERKLTTPSSPVLFSLDGYQLVVVPILTEEAKRAEKAKGEAKSVEAEPKEPEATEQAEPKKASRLRH